MKGKILEFAILGSGRVATLLAVKLEALGHRVNVVYSRNIKHAEKLAYKLYNAQTTDSTDLTTFNADMVLVCLADDAITEVLSNLQAPEGAILVSVSGSYILDMLSKFGLPCAILYPLMTFTEGHEIDWGTIPYLVEADRPSALDMVKNLALRLGKTVIEVSSQQRQYYHLSAVLACNFTNHLLALSQLVLNSRELNFQLLRPILKATIDKAFEIGPIDAQTGPAIRNDEGTINRHLELLQPFPVVADLYNELTHSIKYHYEIGDE